MGGDLSLDEESGCLEGLCQARAAGDRIGRGRFLALNNPAKTYEAGLNERVVLIEFDSLDKALACHDTPAYKEALKVLGTGNVERDMRVVEGK